MTEWKTYTLKELSKGRGEYGIGAPAVPFDKEKYTYLRITDINDDGTLNTSGMMSVDADDAEEYILEKNDIVFARTGNSTGRSYFYDGRDGELVYAGFLIRFRLDETKVNPKILKYYTHSKPYYDWVKLFDTGGTRGNINAKTYGDMPIYLPPRHIQDRIAGILGAIDDKIENNRRINTNLELQAQALFDEIFFSDNDWEYTTLGMLTEEVKTKVKGMSAKVLSPISSGELVLSEDYFTKQVYSQDISKYIVVEPMSFAYNPARINIGSIGINSFDFVGCVSPVYVVFKTKSEYENFFRLFVKSDIFKDEVKSRAIGGVRQTLSYHDFAMITTKHPPIDSIRTFNTQYNTLLDIINHNNTENRTLATLRDTLLPKLMNNEIKL